MANDACNNTNPVKTVYDGTVIKANSIFEYFKNKQEERQIYLDKLKKEKEENDKKNPPKVGFEVNMIYNENENDNGHHVNNYTIRNLSKLSSSNRSMVKSYLNAIKCTYDNADDNADPKCNLDRLTQTNQILYHPNQKKVGGKSKKCVTKRKSKKCVTKRKKNKKKNKNKKNLRKTHKQ